MEQNQGFRYAAEKLDTAKRILERHPELDDDSIWAALHECWLCLDEIRPDELDPPAREWLNRLDDLRGEDGLPGPDEIAKFDRSQRLELDRCIQNLAEWFRRHE